MSSNPIPLSSLTERERQVASLVRACKSNREIAEALSLSLDTVKEYLYRLFRKTGARNRTDLAVRLVD